MDAEKREPVNAPSQEEPTVIFDPARLAAQLSELLELYLARAKDALAEEQMSSKEAVACAKQVAGMLDDTQSGKLQRVDTSTEWPRVEFCARAVGARHAVPVALSHHRITGGTPVFDPEAQTRRAPPFSAPIQTLENAVTAVCQYDEETAILEPWAQLLVRMNQLTQRLSADIEAWKASCEEPSPAGVGTLVPTPPNLANEFASPGGADQPGSSSGQQEEGGAGVGGTGVGGTGDSPVIPPKPAQSRTGGAQVPALQKNPSVQQPTTNGQQPPSAPT